jgi:hypothetical protein
MCDRTRAKHSTLYTYGPVVACVCEQKRPKYTLATVCANGIDVAGRRQLAVTSLASIIVRVTISNPRLKDNGRVTVTYP